MPTDPDTPPQRTAVPATVEPGTVEPGAVNRADDHRTGVVGGPPPGLTTPTLTRRRALQAFAVGGLATTVAGALAACTSSTGAGSSTAAGSSASGASTTVARDAATSSTAGGTASSTSGTGSGSGGTATTNGEACTLAPEVTEGPFYVDLPAVRRDITEGRPGVPLELRIAVVGATTCAPLPGAAVDIWHCDADGTYSGVAAQGNGAASGSSGNASTRFLRGIQLTDDAGVATFTTIFPGWYPGRTIHVHLKVHTGGTASTTYDGGHVNHTGQLLFAEDVSRQVMALAPYAGHSGTRTTNDRDSIYRGAGGTSAIATLTPVDAADPTRGFTATFTAAVDPSATPAASSGPGGGRGGF